MTENIFSFPNFEVQFFSRMFTVLSCLILFSMIDIDLAQKLTKLDVQIIDDQGKEQAFISFTSDKLRDRSRFVVEVSRDYTLKAHVDVPADDFFWSFSQRDMYRTQVVTYRWTTTGRQSVLCKAGTDYSEVSGSFFVQAYDPISNVIKSALFLSYNEGPVLNSAQISLSVKLYTRRAAAGLPIKWKFSAKNQVKGTSFDGSDAGEASCRGISNVTLRGETFDYLCVKRYTEQFKEEGSYSITASAGAERIAALCQSELCVVPDLSCEASGIAIQSGSHRLTADGAIDLRVNEGLQLYADISQSDCLSAENVLSFWWIVARSSYVNRLDDPMTSNDVEGIDDTNLLKVQGAQWQQVQTLVLPKKSIALGSYVVILAATESARCAGQPGFQYDSLKLEVRPEKIRVKLAGGYFRQWRQESIVDSLKLDGSASFETIDDPSDISISWSCTFGRYSFGLNGESKVYQPCFGTDFDFGDEVVTTSASEAIIFVRGDRFLAAKGQYIFRLTLVRTSTGERSYAEQNVKRVWPISTESAVYLNVECLINCQQPVNLSAPMQLKANCSGCDDGVKYIWEATKPDSQKIDLGVSSSKPALTLTPTQFASSGAYTVRVQAQRDKKFVSASGYVFNVRLPPTHGICEIIPRWGLALKTKFRTDCYNFRDEDSPVVYTIRASSGDPRKPSEEQSQYLIYKGTSSTLSDVILPAGSPELGNRLKLEITATNRLGNSTQVTQYLTVLQPGSNEAEDLLKKFSADENREIEDLVKIGNMNGAVRLASAVLSISEQGHPDTAAKAVASIISALSNATIVTEENAYQVTEIVEGVSLFLWNQLDAIPHTDSGEIFRETLKTLNATLKVILDNYKTYANGEGLVKKGLKSLSYLSESNTEKQNAQVGEGIISMRESLVRALYESTTGEENPKLIALGGNETIEIKRAFDQSEPFEIGTSGRQGGIQLPRGLSSKVLAGSLSTLYYNPMPPFPGETVESTFPSPQLPLVAFTILNATSTAAKGRSGAQWTDVFIPIRESANGEDAITSHKFAVLTLPRKCPDESDNAYECNKPATLNLSLPIDDAGTVKPEDVMGYLVFKPRFRCRIPGSTCLKVTLTGPGKPGGESQAFLLPSKTLEEGDMESEPWSVALTVGLVQKVASRNASSKSFDLTILVEDTQVDPFAKDMPEGNFERSQKVGVNLFRTKCFYWHYPSQGWDSSSCENGRLVKNDRIHCRCLVESQLFATKSLQAPLLFGAKLLITPNKIELYDLSGILSELRNSFYVMICMAICWVFYLPFFIWAKRMDAQDEKRALLHIPVDSDPGDGFLYEVIIFTGVLGNASTTANVTIALEGDNGAISDLHVISDLENQLLQRGSIETFLITSSVALGKVSVVKLWHDNMGFSPSWYVDRIAVYDLQFGTSPSLFVANLWLAVDIFPFRCYAELRESNGEELSSYKLHWKMKLMFQIQNTNVWSAPFTRVPCSTYNRQQRVACHMVTIFSCMLGSIMFFDVTGHLLHQIHIGFLFLDLGPFIASAEAAIILMPVSSFCNYVLRNLPATTVIGATEKPSGDASDQLKEVESAIIRPEFLELAFTPLDVSMSADSFYSAKSAAAKYKTLEAVEDKPPYYLPRYCHALSWLAVFVHVLLCSILTVLYGLQYGNEKFLSWLSTFLLSILENMLLITPIRIVCLCTVVAFFQNKKVDLAQWKGFLGPEQRAEAIKRWKAMRGQHQAAKEERGKRKEKKVRISSRVKEMLRKPWCYKKPSPPALERAGRISVAVVQVKQYWKESVTWVIMVALAMLLILVQRDRRVGFLDYQVRHIFKERFGEIKHRGHILPFVGTEVAPLLFDGQDSSAMFKLLGPVRVKQFRLRPVPCKKNFTKRTCKRADLKVDSPEHYESGDHTLKWQKLSSDALRTQNYETPWQNKRFNDLEMTRFIAGHTLIRPYYPNAAYSVDFGYKRQEVDQQVKGLEQAMWIDNLSAAVFIEFSIFTAHLRAVTSVVMAVEMLADGGLNLYSEVNTYRPIYMYGVWDLITILLQLVHVLINGALVTDIILQCREAYRKKGEIYEVIVNVWTLLSVLTIVLTLVSYAIYLVFVVKSQRVAQLYKADRAAYVPFSNPAHYAKIYMYLLTVVAFLSEIRVLKVLRGNRLVSVMLDTMGLARSELISVTIFSAATMAAFAHSGFLSFHTLKAPFKSMHFTILTLLSMSVGLEVPHPTNGIIANAGWALYFAGFMLLSIALFSNLFAAVIDDAYSMTRRRFKLSEVRPVENLAFAWLRERTLAMFGIASSYFKSGYSKIHSKSDLPSVKTKARRCLNKPSPAV